MTKQKILEDFKYMSEFLNELEWNAEVVGEDTEYPTMVASLELDEDCEETVVCNYLILPEEDAEYSKLLQLYCRLPLELETIPDAELIVLANQLNALTTLGHFMYIPATGENSHEIALRYVWAMTEDELPDEGVLGETLLIMMHYCQIMEGILIRRLDGTSMEQLLDEVKESCQR